MDNSKTDVGYETDIALSNKPLDLMDKNARSIVLTPTYKNELQHKYYELQKKLSVRSKNIIKANDLTRIEKIWPWIDGDVCNFLMLKNCGKKSSEELMSLVSELQSHINTIEVENINKVIAHTDVTLLQDLFDNLVSSMLSSRAYNTLERNNLLTIVQYQPYLFVDEKEFLKLKSCGRKTAQELLHLSEVFKVHAYSHKDKSPINSSNLSSFSSIISFSSSEEENIRMYYEYNGHWPMFRILELYLNQTKIKREYIFSRIWGIRAGDKPMSLSVAALFFDYTIEGLKTLLKTTITRRDTNLNTILSHPDWNYFKELKYPYFFVDEKNSNNFANPVLYQLLGKTLYYIDKRNFSASQWFSEDCPIALLIDNRFEGFNINRILKELKRLIAVKTADDINVSIFDYFVCNDVFWDKHIELKYNDKLAMSMMIEDISQYLRMPNVRCGSIIIKSNYLDYRDIVYHILKENGTRMHINEIYSRIQDFCSTKKVDCKFKSPEQIRPLLSNDYRITSIGKSSFWGLKEWGETVGSIREIAIKIARKSRQPILVSDLAKLVIKERPDSNESSVSAIIRQSTIDNELLLFYGDYIGHPDKKYSKDYILMPRTFDEWLQAFMSFVQNNKRFPYSSKDGYEGYLYRWHYRSNQLTDLTPEEIVKFDAVEKVLSHYPHNATENKFLHNCNLYKRFVEGNDRMLKESDDKELFKWFYSATREYSSYNDNRTIYFSQLLQFLSSILY